MNLPDVPLFSMLRERMTWLHQRQDLLSQNVANADTPGYVARDLRPLDFESALRGNAMSSSMMTTDARHIAISGGGQFEDQEAPGHEYTANGTAVSLEQEMIKVADNQAQFQAAANIYAKAMTLMRTAIGH